MEVVAVIDFETTGLSPDQGDRATEIAAVLLHDGKVVDRYQSLMNAGVRIPAFITELTGITDAMVRQAPPAADVMRAVSDFVGDYPLVAHNASFDSRFWDAELKRVHRKRRQEFACSMLVARRVLPQAPSHKLGVLVEFAKLPITGRYHRALADAEMAASLLIYMEDELRRRYKIPDVSHQLLREIQRVSKNQIDLCLERHLRTATTGQRSVAHMRSTRATAAIARLNARSAGRHYTMALGSNGLIKLRERIDGIDIDLSAALTLDEFVKLIDSMGPQKVVRITKSEAAFMKQLVKKDVAP